MINNKKENNVSTLKHSSKNLEVEKPTLSKATIIANPIYTYQIAIYTRKEEVSMKESLRLFDR